MSGLVGSIKSLAAMQRQGVFHKFKPLAFVFGGCFFSVQMVGHCIRFASGRQESHGKITKAFYTMPYVSACWPPFSMLEPALAVTAKVKEPDHEPGACVRVFDNGFPHRDVH
jgi:hypothetical protein